jgi:hypothetical protein
LFDFLRDRFNVDTYTVFFRVTWFKNNRNCSTNLRSLCAALLRQLGNKEHRPYLPMEVRIFVDHNNFRHKALNQRQIGSPNLGGIFFQGAPKNKENKIGGLEPHFKVFQKSRECWAKNKKKTSWWWRALDCFKGHQNRGAPWEKSHLLIWPFMKTQFPRAFLSAVCWELNSRSLFM